MSTRYILITQCLQNDFFFNTQCKLCLPLEAASKLLIGEKDKNGAEEPSQDVQMELAKRKEFDKGPLGLFLKDVTSKRKESAYLFSFDKIPGEDNDRLIRFLKNRFGIEWAEKAKIEKKDSGRTIRLSFEKNYLSLELNNEKTKVKLKIDDGRVAEFTAKMENGELNIHESAILHMVNIRDWHTPGDSYDEERAKYGAHCEEGSWGAEYINGLSKYLDPGKKDGGESGVNEERSKFPIYKKDNIRVYPVYSDSIFDFKPRYGQEQNDRDYIDFGNLMDVLVLGTDEQINELDMSYEKGHKLADSIEKNPTNKARVYMAVIGVYTDIKIKALLMGLVSRYNIGKNLAISDTLTASGSIERHLGALDFANRLLDVEVISGISDLVHFLGGGEAEARIPNETEIVAVAEGFSNYAQYIQDKQNVLAHNDAKLNEYLVLTQKRSKDLYQTINRANQFLLYGGLFLLALTIIAALWALLKPGYVDWRLPAVTGGLSLSQLVTVFFGQPMARLQKNLTNFANFRMILEGHSFKMALMRFHLTTAKTLRGNLAESGAAKNAAEIQIELLEKYIAVIDKTEKSTYEALNQLGLGDKETVKTVTAEKDQGAKKMKA